MAASGLVVLMLAVTFARITAAPLESHMCQLFQTEKNDGLQWHPSLLPASHFQINFRVFAIADVHIVLAENTEDGSDRVIITLGDKMNSESSIYRPLQPGKESKATPYELKCDRLSEYWVQFESRSVKVGRVGERFAFLTYDLDPKRPITPKFLGFGTSILSVGVFSFGAFKEHGPKFSDHVFVTDKGYCYEWILRPWPKSRKVCFQVKSEGVAAVALSPVRDPKAGELLYEIEFGFSNNQMTVVRRGLHGPNVEEESTPDILDCEEFRSFCIEASGPHIIITAPGSPKPIMDFVDSERSEVMYQYIGFAGGYEFEVSWKWQEDMIPDYTIPEYQQDIINLPPEPPVGEDKCRQMPSPCGENGVCYEDHSLSSGFRCECMNNFQGERCDVPPAGGSDLEATTRPPTPRPKVTTRPPAPRPRDPCSPTNPCQNEGKCRRDGASSYSCECKDGYTGTNCETEIPDPCSSEPCLNGGTCERGLGGSYRCGCPPGYSGFNCDIEPEDPCESDPCGNNGMCERNGEFSYMCTCTNGYSGFNCEIEPVKPPSGSELEAKPDHLGECPVFPKDVAGICISNCAADNDCKKTEKCCSNSCGKVCQKACTPVRCRMDCQHGFKRNGNGCEICECKASTEEIPPKETPEDTKVCPEPQCSQECPGGFEKDAYGCKMCDCIEITEGGEDEEEEEEEPEGQVLETTGGSKEIVISNEVNTQQEQLFVIDPNDMLKFTLSSGDGDLTIAVLGTVVELLDSHDNVMRIVKLPTWCLHHKEINFAVNFITTGFKVLIITSSGEERLLTKYEKRSKKKFTCKSLRLTSKKKKRCRVRYKHKRRRRGRRGRKGKLRKFLKKRLRKKRKVCPKVRCSQDCPGGFELDTNGCQMCDCVEITEGGEDEEEEEEEPEGQVLETTGGSKEIVISNEVNTQQEQLFVIDPNDMLKFTLSSGDGDLTIAVLKTAVNILDSKEKVVKSVELPAWCVQYQQLNFAINFITTGFKVLIITSSGEERLLTKYEKKSKKKFTCKSLRLTSKKKKRCRVKYSHRRRRRGSSRRKKFKKKSYVKKTKGSSSSRKKKYKKKSYVKKTKGSSSSRKKKYKKKSYVKKTKGSSSSRKKKYKKKSYVKKARGSSEFDSFINSNFRYVGSFKRELRVLIFL
ncbi:uncharacterized protein LOC110991088 isoform X10 [Acanthaster planci]|uniref:Uncharacterized protein LOC110991088 isoform X10 n=1 Tax=Acanthaster planci TaxID=133434 RepID=A0A8B8A3I8_ACAPL|nr:uncharacterized protein LOC110991088 isoform X10 [Acanthaster planci]